MSEKWEGKVDESLQRNPCSLREASCLPYGLTSAFGALPTPKPRLPCDERPHTQPLYWGNAEVTSVRCNSAYWFHRL